MSNSLSLSMIEFSQKAQKAQTGGEVWEVAQQALSDLGVASMGYAVIPSKREALDRGNTEAAFFVHSYGKEWEDAMQQQPVLDFDLTTSRVLDGFLETHWTDDHLFDSYNVSPSAIQMAKEQAQVERSLGMKHGVTLGLSHQSTGGPTSGVGLCFDSSLAITYDDYWREHKDAIRGISELMDLHIGSQFPAFHVNLSDREKDCLSYLAFGLRDQEIAYRLNLSHRTVEKYMASAVSRLNSRTRAQALAKALSLRLIDP